MTDVAALLGEIRWIGPVGATPTDFLRLLVVPVYGWAAYRDVRTRRVPNRTWIPLVVFGLVLLAADAWVAFATTGPGLSAFAVDAGLSLGFVVPLAYLFWRIGGFGGADAKALMVLALLFPAYPAFLFRPPLTEWWIGGTMPHVRPAVTAFAFTVLTDGVLVGIVYPLAVTLRNLAGGRIAAVMFIGRPVAVEDLPETYGRLLETPTGTTRRGLDLDALRMYLRWRGATLAELRADPARFRDPASLPDEPNPPGDGSIADPPVESADVATDGGRPEGGDGDPDDDPDDDPTDDESLVDPDLFGVDEGETTGDEGSEGEVVEGDATETESEPAGANEDAAETDGADDGVATDVEGTDATDDAVEYGTDPADEGAPDPGVDGDPWGAGAFLDDVPHAYGTTPDDLREGLDVVVEREEVWVSPGLPFLVPLFLGLLVALTYGDLLFGVLELVGLV